MWCNEAGFEISKWILPEWLHAEDLMKIGYHDILFNNFNTSTRFSMKSTYIVYNQKEGDFFFIFF